MHLVDGNRQTVTRTKLEGVEDFPQLTDPTYEITRHHETQVARRMSSPPMLPDILGSDIRDGVQSLLKSLRIITHRLCHSWP